MCLSKRLCNAKPLQRQGLQGCQHQRNTASYHHPKATIQNTRKYLRRYSLITEAVLKSPQKQLKQDLCQMCLRSRLQLRLSSPQRVAAERQILSPLRNHCSL